MTTGTGLDAQVGYKLETAVGTEATVTNFLEFNSESLSFDPGWIEPEGLRVGVKFKRGSRLVQSRKTIAGSLEVDHATRLMGALWKCALGSSVTTPVGATRTLTVTTTNASANITASGTGGNQFYPSDTGAAIAGTGIPGGATLTYVSATSATLSAAATATGSPVATITSTTAFKQVHQTGDLLGKSLTIQVGRPQPADGVVKAHTYRGCKVDGWEFSVSDNDIAKLSLDLDGWDESTATALATASYVNAEVFNFSQCTTFVLGATIAGTTELTATGGTAVQSVVTSLSIKGDSALATERYGLGNAGVKKEQLENGIPTISGTFEAEYSKAEFYDVFKANTATSLWIRFDGSVIGATPWLNSIEFIAPQIRIKNVTPTVDGPDIVKATVEWEVYADGVNNPFQVKLQSADSTAI